ncbi:MAG TPA: ATP-binding cassette domain-containing protein [Erysipelothrix sp.]|nr:ATP-binding cassette domain-containing protein [Erysipelothrix sp.]
MKIKLDINNVSYNFNHVKALDSISLNLEPGIYGLIGPNGAGKTTLLRLISNILKVQEGAIHYNGESIGKLNKNYRKIVGLMPQSQKGYDQYSGFSFLHYMALLKGLSKKDANQQIDFLVRQVSLEDSIHRKIQTYSGGMRQRLMFAQSILGNPKIVILDEPTAGLDPYERIKLRNYVSEIATDKIVILATHVMQDVESIADKLILINNGKIVFVGSNQSLLDTLKQQVYEVIVPSITEVRKYQSVYRVSRVYKQDDMYRVRYIDTELKEGTLIPTFEDAYLYYMVDHEDF